METTVWGLGLGVGLIGVSEQRHANSVVVESCTVRSAEPSVSLGREPEREFLSKSDKIEIRMLNITITTPKLD